MEGVSIILRKPPYGCIDAPEAVRHALGGVTNEVSVKLVLVDSGVLAARKGQDVSDTEYSSIEEGIKDCMDMGVEVFADKGSVAEAGLALSDMIEGVRIADSGVVSGIISNTQTTMIF